MERKDKMLDKFSLPIERDDGQNDRQHTRHY